jgi:hypothetical protein
METERTSALSFPFDWITLRHFRILRAMIAVPPTVSRNRGRVLLIVVSPHGRDTQAGANRLAAVRRVSARRACPLLSLHPTVCSAADHTHKASESLQAALKANLEAEGLEVLPIFQSSHVDYFAHFHVDTTGFAYIRFANTSD